jgi:hypothetical protein
MWAGEQMFEDSLSVEDQTGNDRQPPEGDEKPPPGLYRWAHFPAMLAFGLLFIAFRGQRWRWHIAIGGSYTVYVFFFAFGSELRDLDDFFGDARVPRCIAKLLIPHIFFLALVISGVSLWFYLKPMLPPWLTHEGRKESLWDLFGWLVLAIAGIKQGSLMAGKIKCRFGETED